jgi:carboxyl-terminal processing protease
MRTGVSWRSAWLLLATLAWVGLVSTAWSAPPLSTTPATTPAPTPAATTSESDGSDPDHVLQRALDLERQRNWSAAIEVYEHALEQWPSHTDFSHRRLLCETHYKITRRYQDQSFRNVLLRLPRERALALYDEVLERIETHYVDPVALEPLIRRGLDNLEVALRDPVFLGPNVPGQVSASRVAWLREMLGERRKQLVVPDRNAARAEVITALDLAEQALRLNPAAVVLEFAYGACDALDDYSNYLTPDKLEDLYAMIDGNFVGLGIELKLDAQGLRLVGVIRRGPAWEAGLKVGDQITRVAGQSMRGLSLDEAAGKLQGNEGTAVEITVLRPDGTLRNVKLVRRHVEVESVTQSKIVDPTTGIGYIQLAGFQKTSTEELDRAIAALRQQGMKTLVLDLRGNPGGLLNVAVEIAERFVDKGVIVSTRGRAPGQSQVYRSQARTVWTIPLYVLIDHDSASASEILAGALKDQNRAVLIGERSYGKGSVQSIFALRTVPAGLKLTTAKFYSPRNRPYSEQGVDPNILVRSTLKPKEDEPAASAVEFGNVERDPVLDQAIRLVKRQPLNAAR